MRNDEKINIWFFDVDFTLLSNGYCIDNKMTPIIGTKDDMSDFFNSGGDYSDCYAFQSLRNLIAGLRKVSPVYGLTVAFEDREATMKSNIVYEYYNINDVIVVSSKDDKIDYILNYVKKNPITNPILIDDDLETLIKARKAGIDAFHTTNLLFYLYELSDGDKISGNEFLDIWNSSNWDFTSIMGKNNLAPVNENNYQETTVHEGDLFNYHVIREDHTNTEDVNDDNDEDDDTTIHISKLWLRVGEGLFLLLGVFIGFIIALFYIGSQVKDEADYASKLSASEIIDYRDDLTDLSRRIKYEDDSDLDEIKYDLMLIPDDPALTDDVKDVINDLVMEESYRQAEIYYDEECYIPALSHFLRYPDYKQSFYRIQDIIQLTDREIFKADSGNYFVYQEACELLEKGEYKTAADLFMLIEDYNDSYRKEVQALLQAENDQIMAKYENLHDEND